MPGHEGVEGNEAVDSGAKEAAQGDPSPLGLLPKFLRRRLPTSVSALKAKRKSTVQSRWKLLWRSSPRSVKLDRIDPDLPNSTTFKIFSNIPKPAAAILTQLRSGHAGLNTFLKRIKAVDSPLCDHCREPETAPHYLLRCKKYDAARRGLSTKIGRHAHSIKAILNEPSNIRHTLRYIAATQRFPRYGTFTRRLRA